MAAGDLITSDWEMEVNGVLLGGETAFSISQITGLLDIPDISSGDQARLRRHGLHPGDDFMGGRSVSIDFEVYADTSSDFSSAITSIMEATVPGQPEVALAFQLPGVAGGGKRVLYCRPRRRNIPIGERFFHRVPTASVQFDATDPRIYSASLSTATTSVATSSGGLTFDHTGNFTFGSGGESGSIVAVNSGTFDTGVTFRIDGPCTSPFIENQTTGDVLELDLTIAEGDYVLLNSEARTVFLNGTASRYSSLTTASKWFSLAPGNNSLVFRASTSSGATLSTSWRSAWI